jgi:hypothetical protein
MRLPNLSKRHVLIVPGWAAGSGSTGPGNSHLAGQVIAGRHVPRHVTLAVSVPASWMVTCGPHALRASPF